MSDKMSNSDKLSLPGKKLELKKMTNSFGSGRSSVGGSGKTVQVEVKTVKKKRSAKPFDSRRQESNKALSKPDLRNNSQGGGIRQDNRSGNGGKRHMLRTLTDEEKAQRLKALETAKAAQALQLLQDQDMAASGAEMEAKTRAIKPSVETDDVKIDVSNVELKARNDAPVPDSLSTSEQGPRLIQDVEAKPKTERRKPVERSVSRSTGTVSSEDATRGIPTGNDDKRRGGAAPGRVRAQEPAQNRRPSGKPAIGNRRRSNRISLDDEFGQQTRTRSIAAMRRRQEKEKRATQQAENIELKKIVRDVIVPETITVQELANRMAERGADLVKSLMKMGVMATINQPIDADTAEMIVEEFGHKITRVSDADVEDVLTTVQDQQSDLEPRAPVVTVMGHVDHGKTSLLDALRKTTVAHGEVGGITQHIGAYQVSTHGGVVTFLDTPGHSAFTGMRARGARVTDIVILVVAADDGVMPQTIEAINHAKAAEVPLIIAINKIDVEGADPARVRTELLQHEIVVEAMSGETQDVEVSAKTGAGLNTLLEAIQLQAEILELTANPNANAEAVVVEAKLDKGRGPVATVLVERGTLSQGDIFVVGQTWGRVRSLINDQGGQVDEAGPSFPSEVLGLQSTPEAGDRLIVVETEAKAREIVDYRERKQREKRAIRGATTLDQMFAQAKDGDVNELPVVIKSDVQGSTEAIVGALEKIGNDEVRVQILHSGVGGITESDVTLAGASGALIIGFNVRANVQARELAKQQGTEIRYYSIIYDITDDIKAALTGMLSPELRETFIGYAKVLEVFSITKVGKIAGCRVTEGTVRRNAGVRQLRDDVVVYEGTIKTLKRHKEDVKEVQNSYECGIAFEANQDIKADDMLEVFEVTQVAREIKSD